MAGCGASVGSGAARVGMVFQDYALFPHLTVARERRVRPAADAVGGDRAARVRQALKLVALQHKAQRHPHELSGGERQRVALARALAPGPAVVLLDEPFSTLDASLRGELRREVELILRDAGATGLLVTHDQEEALSLGDRVAVMARGRIVQVGTPEEVYHCPADAWIASFVGEVNVVPGVAEALVVDTELGSFDLAIPAPPGVCRVAVRPEQLEIAPDERDGDGEIVDRDFRGHDVLYRVRHETGRQILVQRPSVELFSVGQRVRVRAGHGAVMPLND